MADAFELREEPVLAPRYNVAPGQEVACVRQADARILEWRRWGLVPAWAADAKVGARLINARSETAATKPAFRRAFAERRALIPADGFYEWSRSSGLPYHVTLAGGRVFGMAGLWERWESPSGAFESCAILTTQASPRLAPLHDRMPVILDPADYALWLEPKPVAPSRLAALLRPWPEDDTVLTRVGRRVNDVGRDDPSLLEPLPPVPEPAQLGLDLG